MPKAWKITLVANDKKNDKFISVEIYLLWFTTIVVADKGLE